MVPALRSVVYAGVAALAFLAVSAQPVRADLKDAVAAYRAGAYKEALKKFTAAAEGGNPVAQYNVGVMYLTGQGVEKNLIVAARWHRLAADQGLAVAQYGLGVMYYRGDGIEQDYAEAARWFRKAANQGLANAEYNLGVMYFNGQGLKREMYEAVKWISLAAAKGHPEALYRLGVMYETGEPFQADPNQALLWYRKAADAGHKAALARAQALGAKLDPDGEGVGDPLTASPTAPPVSMPAPEPPKPETGATVEIESPTQKAAKRAPPPTVIRGDSGAAISAGDATEPTSTEQGTASAKPETNKEPNAAPKTKPPPPETVKLIPPKAEEPPPAPSRPRPEHAETDKPQAAAAAPAKDKPARVVLTPPKPKSRPTSPEDSEADQPGWSVQLAAFRTKAEANQAWQRFSKRHKAILGNLHPTIKSIKLGDKGTFHRLRLTPLQNKTAAEVFCREVKVRDDKQGCLPVPPAN